MRASNPRMRRECPLCGEFMRLERRESVDTVPGLSQQVRRVRQEWVCPECDYFEEADEANPTPT